MPEYPFDTASWQRADVVSGGTLYVLGNSATTFADDPSAGTFNTPFSTLAYAVGRMASGDKLLILPGHAETITSAGQVTCATYTREIIGLGVGTSRPTFTFGTAVGASMVFTAPTKIRNIVGVAGLDGLTNPFHIQAADCDFDLEWRDASDTVEAARAILTTAAADRLRCNLRYFGRTGGNACVNAIRVVGGDGARINVDFYGIASTAVVELITTACTDVHVTGRFYVSGTTDFTKNVVDTVGTSIWSVYAFDAAADQWFKGGNAAAVAGDPTLSAITDALYGANGVTSFTAPTGPANGVSIIEVLGSAWAALLGTAGSWNGIATWPTAAAYANNVSIAEVLGYVQDAVRNGSGTAMATNKSVADALGTDGNAVTDAAVSVLGAIGANNNNNAFSSSSVVANKDGSVLERLEAIQDASGAYLPGFGYKVSKTEDVNVATGVDLFTVTGKVLLTIWSGEVTNALGAAVTDYKLRVKTSNIDLCAASGLNGSAIGFIFNMNGDAGDTLINTASATETADTNGKGHAMRVVGIAGGTLTLQSNRTAGAAGDAIIHTIWYLPLEASASVAAA